MGLMVIDPGFWTTVQDAGRVGYREWGVPTGGAFDRGAADLANALAGNEPDAAVLEMTLRGGTFQATTDLGFALAGAPIEAAVHLGNGRTRAIRVPSSNTLRAGERLVLGRLTQGARSYLAVSHGFATEACMGSRSTEQPLRSGILLPSHFPSALPTRHLPEPDWSDPAAQPLRLVAGPDAALVRDTGFWNQVTVRVGSQSNRMGLRLEGTSWELPADPDRLSAPVAPGAIQIAGGQLILLGVACGTMGGYPHVAHVISADLDHVGQLRPGDHVRFEIVTVAQARALDQAARRAHRALIARVTTLARDSGEILLSS